MSALGWSAEGIERAIAAGGVVLEVYRRPGFAGGIAVRRVYEQTGSVEGLYLDPTPPEAAEDE